MNHQTRPGTVELDVTDVYTILAELVMLAARLPQALRQIEGLLDDLVEHDQVIIVDGDQVADPVAAAAITGHWLAAAASTAGEHSRTGSTTPNRHSPGPPNATPIGK